ncbi:DKNYY domain-containing protein [Bartonella sp. LJL80]
MIEISLDKPHKNSSRTGSVVVRDSIIIISLASSFMFFLVGCFQPSKDDYYTKRDNDIYYHNHKVENIDTDSATIVARLLLKDKDHVWFKGKKIAFLDPQTIHVLESNANGAGTVYADNQGIYQIGFLGKIKKTGSYDKATFQMVGEYFKDKDYLYQYDLYGHPRLQKIKLPPELDLASFRALTAIWYTDHSHVYYSSYTSGPQLANMIDRNSVTRINELFIKDKNYVYSRMSDPDHGYKNLYFPMARKDVDIHSVYDLGNGEIADKYRIYRFERD